MFIARREFLIGAGLALAAPFVVKASSLMPVRACDPLVNLIEMREHDLRATMEIIGIYGSDLRRLSVYQDLVRSENAGSPLYPEPHQWWPVLAYPEPA